ncbi:MAG: hypothetical protein ACSHX5_01345 [Phycisphaerales bacterium]
MDTTDQSSSIRSEALSPLLVECHSCGYEIPPGLGSRCPECSTIWDKTCGIREPLRHDVRLNFVQTLQASGIVWLFVLIFFALGAGVAAQGDGFYAPAFVFFGIGGGVVASNGLGIWICKLGPEHQFRLIASIWIKRLPWLHLPWLSIAGFTLVGSVLAILTRLLPGNRENILSVIVLVELIIWAIVCLAGLIGWFVKYGESRSVLSIVNDSTVRSMHSIFAIMIWTGSVCVGFFGGILGAFFMAEVAGLNAW